MGSAKRYRPRELAKKLTMIRNYFDYSLSEMAAKLSDEEFSIRRTDVSKYELDQREPNLVVLLRYARLVKVSTDMLIDDEIDLIL